MSIQQVIDIVEDQASTVARWFDLEYMVNSKSALLVYVILTNHGNRVSYSMAISVEELIYASSEDEAKRRVQTLIIRAAKAIQEAIDGKDSINRRNA